MRALIIVGSARIEGNTARLCEAVANALTSDDVDVITVHPSKMDISHCTNCGGCDDSEKCVIDDDMSIIYEMIEECDIIILGTPVHFSGVSSIMKQVVDRLQCFWVHPPSKGKTMAAVVCGGSPDPCFRNVLSVCRSLSNSLGAEWGGEILVGNADKGLKEKDLMDASELGKTLYQIRMS